MGVRAGSLAETSTRAGRATESNPCRRRDAQYAHERDSLHSFHLVLSPLSGAKDRRQTFPALNKSSNQSLQSSFLRAVQEAGEVGGNPVLIILENLIKDIDQVDDEFVRHSRNELLTFLDHRNMGLDSTRTREFIQKIGETHFYVLCSRRGVDLLRVRAGHDERPDFRTRFNPAEFFEIKTPSHKGGDQAITALIENSYQGSLEIQGQLDAGSSVAFSEQEIQPYGSVQRGQRVSHVIRVLQNKLRQNVHQGQFACTPTYLVCSLLMLTTCGTSAGILRPTYCSRGRYGYRQCVTGELWMVAFSECDMMIQSEPEFEGKPTTEGPIQSVGILADLEFEYVAGIVFIVYDLSGKSRLLALLRSKDELSDTILKLLGHQWNDKKDSNGTFLADDESCQSCLFEETT